MSQHPISGDLKLLQHEAEGNGKVWWPDPPRKLHPLLTPHTKMNSKCTTDPNVRTKSIKALEENTGVNFCDLALGKASLNISSKAQARKKISWAS